MSRGEQAGDPSLGSGLGQGLRRQEPKGVQEQPGEDGEGNIPARRTARTEAWGPLGWIQCQARVGPTEVLVTSVESSVSYLLVSST